MLEKALISGVTHKAAETVYRVEGVSAARLFDALAEAGVNVDTIIQTGDEIVFSAPLADERDAAAALDSAGAVRERIEGLAKISLIGAGMKSHPGVAADMFEALADEGVNIEIISTSSIRISCVIRADAVERAVRAVHDRFQLDGGDLG